METLESVFCGVPSITGAALAEIIERFGEGRREIGGDAREEKSGLRRRMEKMAGWPETEPERRGTENLGEERREERIEDVEVAME